MKNNLRYFIVTPGRTGSSLLCAIMADAGARFGLPTPLTWPHDQGALEHPIAEKAAGLMRRIEAFRSEPWLGPLRRIVKRRLEKRFAAAMCAFWDTADYVKTGTTYPLVPPSVALGFQPRIILSIREYRTCAASLCRLHADRHSPDQVRELYRAALYNGLVLLHVHGGVVVDFDDLRQGAGWIAPVAGLTGLRREELHRSSRARVEPREPVSETFPDDPEMERLYEQARRFTAPGGYGTGHIITAATRSSGSWRGC